MSKDINPESIWIFSALDKLMGNHKNNPPMFCQLFQKKKLMINLLQERKIDAKKYMKIVGKGIKDPDPLIVSCATSDTMKLKDSKDEDMINQWFKEMIDSTGAFYENQENLYKKYQNTGKQSQIKPVEVQKTQQIKIQPKKVNPPPPESTVKTSLIGGINPEEIVSFKVIDNLLEQNDESKQAFERYLQRKRKLLQFVNNNSLTADKYKAILLSSKQKSKNKEIADDMQFQLDGIEDFHDGNINAWFKELIKETKDNFKDQEKHLIDLQKGKAVKKSKEIQVTLDDDDKEKDSAPVDLKEVNTFKAIDDQLMLEEENKVNYKILLDKKKNLLELKKKGALTAEKYKAMLEKALTQIKNQQIKDSIEMELTLIDDMHDGKLKEWFEDVISSAEMFLEDQVNKLAELEKAGTSKKKVVEEEELIDEEEPHDMKKKPSNKADNAASGVKVSIDFKEIYSLKAIDQYLEQYMKTPEIFCLCFERKLAIFQMMKNGEINPQKYKDLQMKAFKQTKNEKLKDIIEMDLMDLKQMSNNDVNDWFQNLINESGDKYQEQDALYKKWSKKPQTLQVAQNKQLSNISSSISISKQTNSMVKIDEKPIINDVVCFTAIVKLFIYAVERVDIVYYKELEIKRGKLIDLTSQKKLVAVKYRQINKAAASKTTNIFLKNTILEQQARLKGQFKGNEQAWFQSLVTVLNAAPPELKLPENKEIRRLNNSPTPKKADFFLRRMAIYECLFFFFKKGKIPIQTNKYLQEYEKSKRKEVYHCLEMIHKDSSLDVYNLATQMFPDITSDIFYGDNLAGLKKRAESYIPALMKEIAALKDYASKIKRSSNAQNIETAKKEIAKCEENIAYLKSWPSGAMIPFPTITEEKREKYNMDLNSKLDKNDLQVCITALAGLPKDTIMKIYVANLDKQRYSGKVSNGPSNVHFVAKLSEKEIFQVVKGDRKHLVIRFFKEGFFGGLTLICESDIETGFTRSNTIQERKRIGEYEISYVLKVNKPMRPLITQIMHVEVVQHPKYSHDPKVQQQVIKKYLMYSSPTPSEIFVVQP